MSYTWSFRSVVSGHVAKGLDKAVSVTGDAQDPRDFTVTIGADRQLLITVDVSTVVGLFILSDQDLTIETNAVDATGGQTIALTANKPLVWYTGCGYSNPLTIDVTTMYFTNASAATANVSMNVLKDATP